MGDVVEGTVEAIVPGGRALVRDPGGVVLARGGLPGERVQIEVRRSQRGVRHGVVLRVLEASPSRVRPDCSLHGLDAGHCGGCDLLDLAPTAARAVREHIISDALVRVGRLERALVAEVLRPIVAAPLASSAGPDASAHPEARRRARFIIHRGAPTFSSAESHERVPVERCPALHPLLSEALPLLRDARLAEGVGVRVACDDRGRRSVALEGAKRGDCSRIVAAGVADGALSLVTERGGAEREVERAGDPVLVGEIAPGFARPGGEPCASDAGIFTQATRFGGRAILDEVLAAAEAGPGTTVLELFAGAGHLTVPLLQDGAQVDTVEGATRSVSYLEENTRPWGPRVTTRRAYIDGAMTLSTRASDLDVLVADPPRTGIPGFAQLLARARPRRLVLVSCDPATGARDIAAALGRGYTLDRLTPIDAFPRTSHVEWVARLTAGRAPPDSRG